jgi:aspartate aminotransferase
MSLFANVQEAPVDPILGTALAYKADSNPNKVNLGIGAYRTEEGATYVLNVVKKAEEKVLAKTGKGIDKEYMPVDGLAANKALTQKLIFGKADPRIATSQALSGTGALRIVGEFINWFLKDSCPKVYVSAPTWGNHPTIFQKAGCTVEKYPYWDEKSRGFDFAGMMAHMDSAERGSAYLLHPCAHNPTGVDPTQEQWDKIIAKCIEKQFVPILDSAYQGYASGDLEYDRKAIEKFLASPLEMFVCQSFAKNLGLYGERIGAVHIVCNDEANAKRVLSQMKMIIRPMYSSPPCHGALLVNEILSDEALYNEWKVELKMMADRILKMRKMLRDSLEKKGTPGTWNHITDQIGMFSFTGLTVPQCEQRISKHHIYMLKTGRISLAGLNTKNVEYVATAIDDVVRNA